MAKYIEREALIRQIICSMTEFVGAPDDVLKHDEQCNYAINMIEDAPDADVAPVVHGRWVHEHISEGYAWVMCSECEAVIHKILINKRLNYCPNCGAKMDGRC